MDSIVSIKFDERQKTKKREFTSQEILNDSSYVGTEKSSYVEKDNLSYPHTNENSMDSAAMPMQSSASFENYELLRDTMNKKQSICWL